MASIVFKTLSSLTPVDLQYNFYRNEDLKKTPVTHNNGYTFFIYEGLKNYQDIAINNNSCFVLTSSIKLNNFFADSTPLKFGQIPGTFQLQVRDDFIHYLTYNNGSKTFRQTLSGSNFYIQPITENIVELYVNNQHVQVDKDYPYTIRLNQKGLDPEEIHRQRFEVVYQDNLINFKTLTNAGYRFMGIGIDNILRATGTILGTSILNEYVFKCIPVTTSTFEHNFIPTNDWTAYYFDIENGTNNNNLNINKNYKNISTNFLIDFSIEKTIENSNAKINIANLKTAVTPAGGPAPTDNTYTPVAITTN
jgi:hypothetical protein